MNTYEPSIETARLAPACVCNVASRVQWLRRAIKEKPEIFTPSVAMALKPFTDPLPFETELLSQNMDRVDAAIRAIGEQFQGKRPSDESAEYNVSPRT